MQPSATLLKNVALLSTSEKVPVLRKFKNLRTFLFQSAHLGHLLLLIVLPTSFYSKGDLTLLYIPRQECMLPGGNLEASCFMGIGKRLGETCPGRR